MSRLDGRLPEIFTPFIEPSAEVPAAAGQLEELYLQIYKITHTYAAHADQGVLSEY